MDNYKVQVKILKDDLPLFADNFNANEIWEGVIKAIEDGKAAITLIELDSEFESFSIPEDVVNVQEDWDTDFGGDLYLERDFLLDDEQAGNKDFIMQKFLALLRISNLLIYSYFHNGDLYQSYGYVDDTFELTAEELEEIEKLERRQRKNIDRLKTNGKLK